MIRYLLVCCLLLVSVSPVRAETDFSPSATPGFMFSAPTNVVKDLRMNVDVSYVESADFTNELGSVSIVRSDISADYNIFRLSYGVSKFNWEKHGAVTFSTQDKRPWDVLHDVTLQARLLNNSFAKDWRYWVNGELSSSFERDFPGAVGAGLDGGVAYDFWDGWLFGVKAKTIALSALRDDLFGEVEFGVMVAVSKEALWRTIRKLPFMGWLDEGANRVGVSFALSGSEKTYRLAPDSPVKRNGYLGLVRSKVGVYLDIEPVDNLILSLGPEYHYGRKYRLYDSAGKLTSTHLLDNAMGGYAKVLYRF